MIIAAAVQPDGSLGHSWGKARSVVVATVEADAIVDWRPYEVAWDLLHDEGTPGAHHARVVTFLQAHGVEMVLVDHVGDGMRRMLSSMGVELREGVQGDARTAMVAAADPLSASARLSQCLGEATAAHPPFAGIPLGVYWFRLHEPRFRGAP